jgi:hypothetical protein
MSGEEVLNISLALKSKMHHKSHPEEVGNEDIRCHLEPCLSKLCVGLTSLEFVLGENVFEGLKWLAPYGLHMMESVHNVGLDMGVLCGPSEATKL